MLICFCILFKVLTSAQVISPPRREKNQQFRCVTFESQWRFSCVPSKTRSLDKPWCNHTTYRHKANISVCLISACEFILLLKMKCLNRLLHCMILELLFWGFFCSAFTFLPVLFLFFSSWPNMTEQRYEWFLIENGIDECNFNCTLWGLFILSMLL